MTDQPAPPPTTGRPWYCHDRLTDDWATVARKGGDLRMLKTLKIARSIIVNLGIIAIIIFGLIQGANATLVATVGTATLGLYNGIEISDYAALAQAFREVKREQPGNDPDE